MSRVSTRESGPTHPHGHGTGEAKEGFARSLAKHLFGTVDPDVVRFLYDWQLRVEKQGNYSALDPFNVNRHGEYKGRHEAMVATAHMFHRPTWQAVTRDLAHGDTAHARVYMTNHGWHLPNDKLPAPLDEHGDTMPSKGNWASRTSNAVGDTLGGIGDIGGWVKNNIALLVILLVVVLVVAKK